MGTGAATESIDALNASKARVLFDDLRGVCDSDAGELWGKSLNGPMLLVDPHAGVLVANERGRSAPLSEDDRVFVGSVPDDLLLANTAVEWDGVRWSMVLWPVPSDPELRMALLHRRERRTDYPNGATSEDDLERNEGLAEYTGRKLAHQKPESAVADQLGTADGTKNFVRSFAYFTGPAYGLLLDRLMPGWPFAFDVPAEISESP